ncbi:hypothetical protein KEM52_006519 [Ascosphaera acerosa]|nr:hypothetical protein KEM52_006519 [Ascosphaera acerosa]
MPGKPTRARPRSRRHGRGIAHLSSKYRLPSLAGSAGPLIYDDYATFRDHYETPRCPVVLAHGLMGFDELRVAGNLLPPVRYWRGIEEELLKRGIHAISVSVEPLGSIQERAEALMAGIEKELYSKAEGELGVNVIAGLDSRYMITHLQPTAFRVRSLTTISTPHRGELQTGSSHQVPLAVTRGGESLSMDAQPGSSVADWVLDTLPRPAQDAVFGTFRDLELGSGGIEALTRKHMNEVFNPSTPDVEGVKYRSYGAVVVPRVWSAFRKPYKVLLEREGPNDGLVSVESARWGQYMGTLVDVDHLDLINWANRARRVLQTITGKQSFNAVAFYLNITDQLAKEGL